MTDAARFRRVDELFRGACALDAEARRAFLDARCGGDEDLKAQVEALLEEDAASGAFLEEPALGSGFAGALLDEAAGVSVSASPPKSIGRYRVTGVIGEGGMGIVYEAEQQSPRRAVALKVIRPGQASAAVLKRFELEAQLLARLRHPGIAQIYEAGVVDADGAAAGGRPFFAMELVRGVPLLQFAQQQDLSLRQRLDLVARICDAVQHAHANGVIHRDLKPGNILVEPSGQAKILDFGVARATDSDVHAATMHTHAGQLVGTVPYMSPEQATGDSNLVDTRSDVYALGVILYELIAGRLPYPVERASVFEAVRVIREDEPTRLSSVDRRLRGDVETIVRKALEKDKNRRYQSASELAADIRRFLSDEPILARPASAVYQIRKFAKRNKAIVSAAAAAMIALLIGLTATGLALRQTRSALRRAERQTRVAEAINGFMNEDLLASAVPERQGRDVTVRKAVDIAADKVDEKFGDDPIVAAAIHNSIGNIYWSLGVLDAAETNLKSAVGTFDAGLGPDDPLRLAAMTDLASFYMDQYRPDDAEPLLEEVVARQRALDPDDRETLRAESDYGTLLALRQRFDEAESQFKSVLGRMRRDLGEDDFLTAQQYDRLGSLYLDMGKYTQAEPYYTHALTVYKKIRGEDHPLTLATMNNIAVLDEKLGRLDKAAAMQEHILSIEERLRGRHHPQTLPTLHNLASVYISMGRYDEAEPLLKETLAACRKTFGPDHYGTLTCMLSLAEMYVEQKRYDEAEPLIQEAADTAARTLGDDDRTTLQARQGLATLAYKRGDYERAASLFADLVERSRRVFGDGAVFTGIVLGGRGATMTALGRLDDAEKTLLEAHRILAAAAGESNSQTRQVVQSLADLYDKRGEPDKAADWRSRLK